MKTELTYADIVAISKRMSELNPLEAPDPEPSNQPLHEQAPAHEHDPAMTPYAYPPTPTNRDEALTTLAEFAKTAPGRLPERVQEALRIAAEPIPRPSPNTFVLRNPPHVTAVQLSVDNLPQLADLLYPTNQPARALFLRDATTAAQSLTTPGQEATHIAPYPLRSFRLAKLPTKTKLSIQLAPSALAPHTFAVEVFDGDVLLRFDPPSLFQSLPPEVFNGDVLLRFDPPSLFQSLPPEVFNSLYVQAQ